MTLAATQLACPARVLIVDDLADNRELLEIILAWDGLATLSASSGEEALDIARREPLQLVLLDLMLPGIDGCEVARRLKADPFTTAIPILVLSAMSSAATRARVIEAGAEDLITKPIQRKLLCARIRELIGDAWPNVAIVTD